MLAERSYTLLELRDENLELVYYFWQLFLWVDEQLLQYVDGLAEGFSLPFEGLQV